MTGTSSTSQLNPLHELRRDIKLCQRCVLCHTRTNAVPGEGPSDARIVLVGEAPGGSEDDDGVPFVGKAGKKLNEWLATANLTRDELFITNVLKCQPPENKFPKDAPDGPVDRCLPYLWEQIRLIQPWAIIVTGRQALQHLVLRGSAQKIDRVDDWVGKILRRREVFGDARIGVLFHPAYILRNRNPIEEDKCVRTVRTIAAFVASRRRGEAAPVIDLHDIAPAAQPVFQQRFRVLKAAQPPPPELTPPAQPTAPGPAPT